jgi:hypothetical protein
MLDEKGFYIWQIARIEGGNVDLIADLAEEAALKHILIKIADGSSSYNISPSEGDLVPPLVNALQVKGIECWGWHYIYGRSPSNEAAKAIQRVQQTGVVGYVIDAEGEFKAPGMDVAARSFMDALRTGLPTFPVGLSSYRYPTLHQEFPWDEFLSKSNYALPQVYWVGKHNPAEQLERCLAEYSAITSHPIIPTGSAYSQGDWSPTLGDLIEFLDAAQVNNLGGANFWEWFTARQIPELWNTIASYSWGDSQSPIPPRRSTVRVRVWAHALNVRSGPSSSYPVVGKLRQDTRVSVLSLDRAWVKISPDHEWWVYSYYLEPIP